MEVSWKLQKSRTESKQAERCQRRKSMSGGRVKKIGKLRERRDRRRNEGKAFWPFLLGFPSSLRLFSKVFSQMRDDQISPDVVAFNATLSALDHGLLWQEDATNRL